MSNKYSDPRGARFFFGKGVCSETLEHSSTHAPYREFLVLFYLRDGYGGLRVTYLLLIGCYRMCNAIFRTCCTLIRLQLAMDERSASKVSRRLKSGTDNQVCEVRGILLTTSMAPKFYPILSWERRRWEKRSHPVIVVLMRQNEHQSIAEQSFPPRTPPYLPRLEAVQAMSRRGLASKSPVYPWVLLTCTGHLTAFQLRDEFRQMRLKLPLATFSALQMPWRFAELCLQG